MSFFTSHSAIGALSLLTAITISKSADAQLVGCASATSCPLNPSDPSLSTCVIGNALTTELGITNLSSIISPEPLTWAVGISHTQDPQVLNNFLLSRDFYLGTPPSLDLRSGNAPGGCALFFDGITTHLSFPHYDYLTDVGTCGDALGEACLTDLMSQANSKITQLMSAADNSTLSMCSSLELALQNSAPETCNMASNGSWGAITVKDITGPATSPPLQLGQCVPSTGTNYTITHVENYNISAPDLDTLSVPFDQGVTPIMTIFFPVLSDANTNTTSTSSVNGISTPEVHLSCLKVVGQEEQNSVAFKGAAPTLYPNGIKSHVVGVTVALMAMILIG